MPIKLPKGFQRRKSSGHALDEVRSPPGESTFRVLERPASKGKSFDGGVHLRMTSTGAPMPPPKDHDGNGEVDIFTSDRPDASNRGSGGTERSHSTAPYDSAASSARLSTSSTNPSSIDTRSDKNVQAPGTRPYNDIPVPPPASARPGFLRSPARTFSFGVVKGSRGSPTSPDAPLPPVVHNRRNRTVTESTASTATPPRLFDSDLALENTELDAFGNMFDHIGSSPDPGPTRLIHQEVTNSSPVTSYPPTAYPGTSAPRTSRAPPPHPISTDRSQAVESSPYSWNSQNSRDGLMRSPSPSTTITQGSPGKSREAATQKGRFGSMFEVSTSMASRRPIGPKITTQEQELHPAPLSPTKSKESAPPSASSARSAMGLSPASVSGATFDPVIAENAQLANMYQEAKDPPPKRTTGNKVMTPAQWERYKEQKEMDRRLGALSDDSASEAGDISDDDDDDELERSKQAAKQRRKQEAHLAVYRQTMMKVTGEAPPNRPGSSLSALRPGNGSSPDLNNRMSHMTVDSKTSGKSSGEDEEEDEDVPLGILAAHGFPNRNRPPTQLASSSSNSNLRAVSQSQAAPSVKGSNLPVFARQLPPDPYYGAGLVNPSNREALALHPTTAPQGAGPSTAHPIHPSGLVGVIAGEERARAARRGSPNAAGGYDMPPHPSMARSQTTGTLPAMGYHGMSPMPGMPPMMPGMPPMLTAGDQAQIQMAQQMTQMMQMQMQWMQQMSQTMGVPGNPNPMNVAQYPGPPNPSLSRPQSVHMQHASAPHANQRTMSTLNPSMAPWNSGQQFLPSININGNYAPSIAPSERSNIGLASRYRPVSIAPEPDVGAHRRASTFTSASMRPWSSTDNASRPVQHGTRPSINTLGRKSPLAVQDEDDDEQGWAEMKMKKDKKQKSWALRKGQNALQELYNPAS
ncbi:hypothetical protein A1O7_01760 [Cladophialophora yegresii CBS 114405]|uniref:Uncharacterized protein n=1 Tax=Cladophialophora yegresii CBS 114405 TaxID=1182544 RepID=W9X4P8_9EURO|nr:uncharacterized protein A1O7_01760 [Cladophialophora yegresii CBS 114405]EXJ65419.1 hypothetical protein A1O7_01760 [Cladophialophora yegresii CBS 114405]